MQSRVSSTFGRGGGNNYGSSAHQEWLGKSLAETALPIYAQNYQQERGKQVLAQQAAPGLDTADINQLANVGMIRDAYQQALINAEKQRHDFNQLAPWDALQRYGTAVQGNVGESTTGSQPYYPANPYMNLLGGTMAGLGIYGMGKNQGLWGGGGADGGGTGGMGFGDSGGDYGYTGDFGGYGGDWGYYG